MGDQRSHRSGQTVKVSLTEGVGLGESSSTPWPYCGAVLRNRALRFGAGWFSVLGVLGTVTVCRVLSSIPGFYLLNAGDNQNHLQTLAGVPTAFGEPQGSTNWQEKMRSVNKSKLRNRAPHDPFRKGIPQRRWGCVRTEAPAHTPALHPTPGDVETVRHSAVEG